LTYGNIDLLSWCGFEIATYSLRSGQALGYAAKGGSKRPPRNDGNIIKRHECAVSLSLCVISHAGGKFPATFTAKVTGL
jgi:hypothetical protein